MTQTEFGFPMPLIVQGELNKVKNRVLKRDRDWVCVIDGEEGVGKSVLAQQIAKYLDPNFNLDKIVFNSDDFLNLIKNPNTKKGDCIVLDEAFAAANSRASLTEVNRAMIGVATEMRQKNLFIILCIPSFFDLDRYFALWRCRALFHVFFDEEEDRHFIIFPKDQKKFLYLNGKKYYNYSKPKSPFPVFNFSNFYVVNEEDYRFKKANAFKRRVVSLQAQRWIAQRNAYIKYILQNTKLTQDAIGNIPDLYKVAPLTGESIREVAKDLAKYIDEVEKKEKSQEIEREATTKLGNINKLPLVSNN